MKLAILVALSAVLALGQAQVAIPRLLGTIPLNYAAFVEVYDDIKNNNSDRYTLYISTFNPINFSKDPKYYLRSPGNLLGNVSAWEFQTIDQGDNTAVWPNNPDFMPAQVAGAQGLVWTSGFLVPGKTKGSLELYDTVSDPPVGPFTISSQDTVEWSYHRVIWKDMDKDGDLDALTARFHKPILGNTHTQFAWLENPGLNLRDTPVNGWTQHVIQDSYVDGNLGPDVHFRNFELVSRGETFDCILSAEFWREQLVLYYTSTGWSDWTQVRRIPIDITLGQPFDVYLDDFNRDGKIDILATGYNHTLGNVFAYEIPEDFRNGTFTKHTLADGFKANPIIGGQSMTPGSPKPFYPSKAYEDERIGGRQRKPYIIVSGDDDGKHYILEPNSEDANDWSYTKHILVDTEKTTSGKFAVVDLDGDGYTEIVAAGYSSGTIYVYTYKP
ncbi:unnamed protein product [Allacma fusca]|uniref:Uncharacterized protein n=1 Tax=Allacma fusca TaxID=39272 RepID=A0A8J2LIV4_9HEXA|nr:unnamed protein product [Allacma fusca]